MQARYGIGITSNDCQYYRLSPDGFLIVWDGSKFQLAYNQDFIMNNVSYIGIYNATQNVYYSDAFIMPEMQKIIDSNFVFLTTNSHPFNWDTFKMIGITPDGYNPVKQHQNQFPGFTGGGNNFGGGGYPGQGPYNITFSFGNHPNYKIYLDTLINASLPILLSLVAPKAIYAAAERFGYEAIANSPLTGVCAFALAGIATYKLQNRYLSIQDGDVCKAMIFNINNAFNYNKTPEELSQHITESEYKNKLMAMTSVPAVSVGLCYTASAYLACSWMYNQPELEIPSAVVTILIGSTGVLAGLLTSMRAEAIAKDDYYLIV